MQGLENYIEKLNSEFAKTINGEFVRLDTGQIFNQIEVTKYLKRQIEIYNADILSDNAKKSFELLGVYPDQRLVNKRSKKPEKKTGGDKGNYEGGDFNIVYRKELKELTGMNLSKNEKLVFFIIRDFVVYPYNYVMINGEIPRFTDLESLVSLTERSIRDALKLLEEKEIVKLVQSGKRKAVYINPKYYATGKDLNIDTLKMFNLIECDDEKIDSYIEQ